MRYACLAGVVLLMAAGQGVSAQKKPNTHPPVPLIVTVHDEVTPGVPCGICGDGIATSAAGSDYTDGVDGVSAVIDQYGNLIIDFQTSRTQLRGLTFRNDDGITFSTGTNQGMATKTHAPTSSDPDPAFVPLQNMEIGDQYAQRVRSCPTYDDEQAQRRYVHTFRRNCYLSNSADAGSSFLIVTRVATGEWTVASQVLASHRATLFSVPTKGRIGEVTLNTRSMPFKMTLTHKNP